MLLKDLLQDFQDISDIEDDRSFCRLNMFLKSAVLFLKISICLLLSRPFLISIVIIHDPLSQKLLHTNNFQTQFNTSEFSF